MSLIPYYLYEEGTELPDEGNYYIIARNGVFLHKDCGHTKGIVKVDESSLPFIKNFEPPKPKPVPIYVCEDDCELPKEGTYYILAKNGIFAHKDYAEQRKFLRADFDDLKWLGRIQTRVRFELPKIPVDVIFKTLTFFRRVWYEHHAEAAVVLYFNKDKKEYYVRCPRQEVSGGGVRYGTFDGREDTVERDFESEMRSKGFVKVGTIHSHCNFSAYHSGVDTNDESVWPDGVHITLGHVDKDNFSVAASLVMNNNRFQVDPTSITEGLTQGRFMGFRQSEHFKIDLKDKEKEAHIDQWHAEIEEEWMKKVSKYTYTSTGPSNWKGGMWGGNTVMDDKPDPNTHVSACVTARDTRVARVCVHCQSINMEEMGRSYTCAHCSKHVGAYAGYIGDKPEPSTMADLSDSGVPASELALPSDEVFPLAPTEGTTIATEVQGTPPVEDKGNNFLYKVRSHACALRNHAGHIPAKRLSELLATLKKFFKKDAITDEDILIASQVNPKASPSHYEEKGYAVR
jgi:proteasome lid subunit RPN8/RPN11